MVIGLVPAEDSYCLLPVVLLLSLSWTQLFGNYDTLPMCAVWLTVEFLRFSSVGRSISAVW
jgi:hypothetical protein